MSDGLQLNDPQTLYTHGSGDEATLLGNRQVDEARHLQSYARVPIESVLA